MYARQGPVLALSDLSVRSDHALRCAGHLAAEMGTELHVLHAMALTGRTLREAIPILHSIGTAIRDADDALRAQIERAVTADIRVAAPRVDVDNTTKAMLVRAREIIAGAIVVPAHWQWQRFGHNSKALSHLALGTLRAPLLINACLEPRVSTDRVAIVAHPESLDAGVMYHTEQWNYRVAKMNSDSANAPLSPDFEVFLLDGSANPQTLVDHIQGSNPDLIAVATDSFRYAEGAAALSTLTNMLAVSGTATVMLPASPSAEHSDDASYESSLSFEEPRCVSQAGISR
jgi:nucleotide-binding universal stress UspA family protein